MANKLRIVLNRFGSDFWEGDIDIKKAEETIGKPFTGRSPTISKRNELPCGGSPLDSAGAEIEGAAEHRQVGR